MKYALCGYSELEIPDEQNLVIYITNCQNHCVGCHTPFMNEDYGDLLSDYFMEIYEAYKEQITCVCFMGEGKNTEGNHKEFKEYCEIIHNDNKSTALYSGRNCEIEEWMKCFDFIKIGPYIEKYGPLTKNTTNQRLYKKIDDDYFDITSKFWKKRS